MMRGTLESKSLWYRYKTKVWLDNTPETAVVHNAMRVLRSIRYSGDFAYVSNPITSGKFLYELMLERPLVRRETQVKLAMEHNYRAGLNFVRILRQRLVCPIIYPADLAPARQQWEQDHFQALWLSITAEKCTELHMADGWEFSNGCSEELVHAMQLRLGLPRHSNLVFYNTKENEENERMRMRNIKVFDHVGSPLCLKDGIDRIESALSWLKRHDLEAKKLKDCLGLLRWTEDMLSEKFYQ
ncbi:MAG: hypothetical protein A2939_05100 [Parcubacteria group bacterium RIFCSPLOWO2_01_FULL_48_18]|nr:MAG: hypothetical protein A3J67_03425 [Parcubacteria group bacterium RIFCSPHIGHO2_02_FULL_48_10b]OHB22245.1 MAG: hypothetical protein A2939_05100 [Parcubacteria group bacterium RIFCSPLOWO2_01_FULL_48_18]